MEMLFLLKGRIHQMFININMASLYVHSRDLIIFESPGPELCPLLCEHSIYKKAQKVYYYKQFACIKLTLY